MFEVTPGEESNTERTFQGVFSTLEKAQAAPKSYVDDSLPLSRWVVLPQSEIRTLKSWAAISPPDGSGDLAFEILECELDECEWFELVKAVINRGESSAQ